MPALKAFLTVSTQWRRIALAPGPVMTLGLDYAGVKAGLKLAGIKMKPDLWAQVQVIEQGARAALNEG